MTMPGPRYLPIRDYGIIGDLHSAALVSRLGSIDWFCAPRFDSPSIFGRILDADKGGSLCVTPGADFIADSRRYLPGTNVLETTLSSANGRLVITDFMVAKEQVHRSSADHLLVRQLEAPDGQLEVKLVVDARFDYGREAPEAEVSGDGHCLRLSHKDMHLHLDGPGHWEHEGRAMVQGVQLTTGSPLSLLLRYDGDLAHHRDYDAAKLLRWTQDFWEDWSKRCQYHGPYEEYVLRSALVLKLLIYAPEGSMVAAPTTSLPEWIGGQRNWDYRYSWLRDSAFLLYNLQLLGYSDEETRFVEWLGRVHEAHPGHFHIIYGIDGRTDIDELELGDLEGYQSSKPVRIGNGAAHQEQRDIYGEVVDSAYIHHRYGKVKSPLLRETLTALVDEAAEHWQEPDNGIWEMRTGPQQFVYSKVQCWVALDRGIRLSEQLKLDPVHLERWMETRKQIRHTILTRGWSDKLGAFRQILDEDELDAATLMIPMLRFLPARDPRMRQTVQVIQRDLTDKNGFVYRYRRDDGLGQSEGTFLLCSFWLVTNLAMQGQLAPAQHLFEQLTANANDLGLLSEELDPDSGELLGNFPQAFTHMGVVNAAAHLERAAERYGWLARWRR
jgi:GH15 family glucan-1,4-alpha-glucosidase